MLRGSVLAAFSRWILPPRFIAATMFWTVTVASFRMSMPPFLSFFTTVSTASAAISFDLEPVHTILPVLNIRVAVFGTASLNTKPGNRSGWYSVPGNFSWMSRRSIVWPTDAVATTFSILITGLVCGMVWDFLPAIYQ